METYHALNARHRAEKQTLRDAIDSAQRQVRLIQSRVRSQHVRRLAERAEWHRANRARKAAR